MKRIRIWEEEEKRDHGNLGQILCGSLGTLLYAEHEELWLRYGSLEESGVKLLLYLATLGKFPKNVQHL